jgi:hypothetical protein
MVAQKVRRYAPRRAFRALCQCYCFLSFIHLRMIGCLGVQKVIEINHLSYVQSHILQRVSCVAICPGRTIYLPNSVITELSLI